MPKYLHIPLTPRRASELTALFFEGRTTEEEERALKIFLASPDGQSTEFDEIRAVLAFCARHHKRNAPLRANPAAAASDSNTTKRRRLLRPQRWAAAACVALMAATGIASFMYQEKNQCVAYVSGKKITDSERVLQEMHHSIRNVGAPPQETDVEAELRDMFKTIQ